MSLASFRGLGLLACSGILLSCSTTPPPESQIPADQASPGTETAITIDGSSTVYPLTNEIVQELQFEKQDSAPNITVEFSGTGGGFRKFCAGETDINNASRPILKAEMESCAANGIEYIELPVAFDALTVVVHESNDWANDMTVQELKALWEPAAEGKITRWNQVRSSWPDRPINLYGADPDSGTYDSDCLTHLLKPLKLRYVFPPFEALVSGNQPMTISQRRSSVRPRQVERTTPPNPTMSGWSGKCGKTLIPSGSLGSLTMTKTARCSRRWPLMMATGQFSLPLTP